MPQVIDRSAQESPPVGRTGLGSSGFGAIVFALACVRSVAADEPAQALQSLRDQANGLQAACLDYREEVTAHGRVFLRIVEEHREGASPGKQQEAEHRIWFSGDLLRFDVRGRTGDESWSDWEHYVVGPDEYIWIPEGEFQGVVAPAAEFASQAGGTIGHFVLYHPRWLGMGQNSEAVLQSRPGSRFVDPGLSKADYTEVSLESLGDRPVPKVVRRTSFPPAKADAPRIPGEFVMWFAPDAGHSLIRAEIREFAEPRTIVRSVENRLGQFPHGGVWFPREVVRETKYGDEVTRRQVISIHEAEFGRPPRSTVFTLQGIQLAEGKRVSDRTEGPRPTELVSDGNKIVELRGPTVQPAAVPDATGQRSWLLLMNAAVLALLAGYFFVRMLKSPKNAASEDGNLPENQ